MAEKNTSLRSFYKKLGPGLITGASDDDPSGIVTYTQAGAQFGSMTLWSALFTFPLMVAVQEMCARIAMVTGHDLTHNIKQHYSKTTLYLLILFTIPAIILNIAADIASMGAVSHLVIPYISSNIFCIFYTVILAVSIIFLSYQKIVMVLKYCCFSLALYIIIPFIIDTPWLSILKHTFLPSIQLNKEFLGILVAILGTTISPYMFFWQATMAAEGGKIQPAHKRMIGALKDMRYDVFIGMLASNLVMFFIILTAGTVLFHNGIHQIDTVEQAAKALEPLAGHFAYCLFTLGILGTGFLAIPVLSGSLAYILSTTFNIKKGLNKQFYQATSFYLIILASLGLALIINFIGLSPIKALLWTAVLYGLTAPLMIFLILHMANNKKMMKHHVNGGLSNIFGGSAFILMSVAAVLLIYFTFF